MLFGRKEFAQMEFHCMIRIFVSVIFIIGLFIAADAQIAGGYFIAKQDIVLLSKFWQGFKKAVDQKDKISVERNFKFPFYFRPCLYYAAATDSFGAMVKVTRKIFRYSVYKLFFSLPQRNNSTKSL
jgi:hypothetical protein